MKKFEFEIVDNKWLEIADFTWSIDDINAIYIDKTNNTTFLYPEHGIYIETDSETDLLYYRTDDEIKISNAFKKLVSSLQAINPNFKNFFPACFNIANVKNVNWKKIFFMYKVDLEFKNNDHQFNHHFITNKKNLKKFIEEYNTLSENNLEL